jgi:hypothetical protein
MYTNQKKGKKKKTHFTILKKITTQSNQNQLRNISNHQLFLGVKNVEERTLWICHSLLFKKTTNNSKNFMEIDCNSITTPIQLKNKLKI